MNAFKTGMKFEKHVQSIFVKHGFHVFKETGGSKCGPDISILYNGVRVNFECKTKNAFEGGGRVLHMNNGKLRTCDTFFDSLLNGVDIWGGRVPQFKLGNKDFTVWMNESIHFKDIWIDIDSTSVARYYACHDIHYVIIEKTGIYHTGKNPMNIYCPYFECHNRLRIRCKRHSSSSMPSSVQASLVFSKKLLKKFSHSKSTYGTHGSIC